MKIMKNRDRLKKEINIHIILHSDKNQSLQEFKKQLILALNDTRQTDKIALKLKIESKYDSNGEINDYFKSLLEKTTDADKVIIKLLKKYTI